MATEKKAQVLQLDPPHELIFKGRASGLYGCLTDDPCVGGFNEIGFRRDVRIKCTCCVLKTCTCIYKYCLQLLY